MRSFPSRKSWSNRDRLALLGNDTSPSPPASPTTPTPYSISGSADLDAETMSMFPSLAGSTFPDPPSKVPSVRGQQQQNQQQYSPPSSSSGAIQFIPAYKESVSPTNTHPLTSPEDSFDKEDKNHQHRPTIRHRPQVTTPSPSNTNNNNTYRNNTGSSSDNNRRRGPRMARLASLFSSRAAVKMAEKNSQKPMEESSPPDSDTSSGYVGWPGTQDRRGKTVVVDSSYTDSDPGPSKDPEGVDASSWNNDNNMRSPTEKFSTSQHAARESHNDEADFHLTSALVDAAAAANSPIIGSEKQHRMSNHPMHGRVTSLNDIYGRETGGGEEAFQAVSHPWAMNTSTSDDSVSDVSTSFSKTSSAYFNPNEVRALARGKIKHLHGGSVTSRPKQDHVAAAVMRLQKSGEPPRLTDEALALKNQLTPPHRVLGNSSNAVGYRGYIDKTKDVPNLMDDTESDSSSSRATSLHSARSASRYRQNRQAMLNKIGNDDDQILEEASSDIFDGVQNGRLGGGGADAESDVFDGVSNAGSQFYPRRGAAPRTSGGGVGDNTNQYGGDDTADSQLSPTLVLLGGGLTTIQTSVLDFTNRKTASDFDENLTNSDYDQYGFAKIPGFNEMASMGTSSHDRSLSSNTEKWFPDPSPASTTNLSARAKEAIERHRFNACDQSGSESGSSLFSNPYSVSSHTCSSRGLSQYYVHPDKMKIVVKYYRKMNKKLSPHLNYEDLLNEEDATKAFALSEMRSRIMEKDIERGLERKGGTTVVDDIVLTDYNKSSLRVRDAVIVSKAWRDGARPMDVINTAFLTRRSTRSYHIPRLANRRFGNGRPQQLTWEEVLWVDDLELSQFRCHSIGPRHLRGFEMFTIGDCQSILLKLCRDQCEDLQLDLNEATARQIEAEDVMKDEEGDGIDGMMTEAEMTYLIAMEDVKTYSKKLVIAEKSFNLVKERIENLVSKYESLLVKFDNDAESIAPSSVITYESSCYSDAYTNASEVIREREELLRRAERAEVRAELAAREALLARKESRAAQAKNQLELQALHQRLDELQSEPSAAVTDQDHSVVLARVITAQNRSVNPKQNIGNDVGGVGPLTPSASAPKSSNKIEDVKRRFRDRSAAKKRGGNQGSSHQVGDSRMAAASNSAYRQVKTPAQRERENLYRQVGEEMFQQMDFYERSLKAVETDRKF